MQFVDAHGRPMAAVVVGIDAHGAVDLRVHLRPTYHTAIRRGVAHDRLGRRHTWRRLDEARAVTPHRHLRERDR